MCQFGRLDAPTGRLTARAAPAAVTFFIAASLDVLLDALGLEVLALEVLALEDLALEDLMPTDFALLAFVTALAVFTDLAGMVAAAMSRSAKVQCS